jgi:hypothetical protein
VAAARPVAATAHGRRAAQVRLETVADMAEGAVRRAPSLPPLQIPGEAPRAPLSPPASSKRGLLGHAKSMRMGRTLDALDASSTVGWRSEPQVTRAKVHRKMVRPCWVPCEVDKQHPTGRRTFDPDRWRYEWLDDPEKSEEERPRLYPIWSTTPDELAVIGGSGVRLYFALLRLVTSVFFMLAVIMTGPICINLLGEMYDMPAAREFVTDEHQVQAPGQGDEEEGMVSPFGQTFWARTTLGGLSRCNVTEQMPNNFVDCDVPQDESGVTSKRLLWYACLDLLAALIVLIIVKKMKARKMELDELSDAAMVSMSDYSVQLRPRGGHWLLPAKADAPMGQQRAFKENLRDHIEKHLGKVAMVEMQGQLDQHDQVQKELGIWLAFPEEQRIGSWKKKVQLLYELEEALARLDGTHAIGFGRNKAKELPAAVAAEKPVEVDLLGAPQAVKFPEKTVKLATKVSKLVLQLEKLNEELTVEGQTKVVCAFVTFEDEKDQDKACDLVLNPKTKSSAVHPEPEGGPARDAGGENGQLENTRSARGEALHFAGREFRVREAPEPDTIRFSHLQYTANRRNVRRTFAILTLVSVLVGFNLAVLEARKLTTDTAFGTVCPTITWDPSSDYALCDGAYAGNFSTEAQAHYKSTWQTVEAVLGTKLPLVAKVALASSTNEYERASCASMEDSDCCSDEHSTWDAAADYGCTRVWTVDANLSFFPTVRGDGLSGLRACDIDRNCKAEPLGVEPGRPAGSRPLCQTMDCPSGPNPVQGAYWQQNPLAAEEECVGGPNQGCDPTDRRDLERCCTKTLVAEMSRGHSVEAVCYHCICDCLEQSSNGEVTDDYPNGCPFPEGGWSSADIETYCDGDKGWNEWSSRVSLWSTFNSVLTTLLNQILKAGLEGASELEKAHTRAQEQSSLAIKVAMAQFTNTVILSMISTMYIKGGFVTFSNVYPADGLTPWANSRWYYQVGTAFMTTMAINQCLPPAIHAGKYWVFRFLQRLKLDKGSLRFGARTQNRLNRIYEFNQWKLASSYGEVLFVLSSTLLLCTALPMLLWISTFGMGLKYWGDKTAVLRCYQKPPLYSSDLFDGLDTKLYIILAAHLVSATYFLSVAGGYTPDEAFSPSGARVAASNRLFFMTDSVLTQPHVLPLWISAAAIISYPVGLFCYDKCRGKDHRLARLRKKKIDAVQRRIKQTQRAMYDTLKRRYAFTQSETEHLQNLVLEKDCPEGPEGLKSAVDAVLQEREAAKANQDSGGGGEDSPKKALESVADGFGDVLRTTSDKLKISGLIHGVTGVISKADDLMHKSPVGKVTDAVGHVGKAVVKNTAGAALGAVESVAGKGLAIAAAGGGAAAGKMHGTASRVRTATGGIKLGRDLSAVDLDGLDDEDLFGAVSGSIREGFSLVLGDFGSEAEVDDPDARLPCFSRAQEQELLINTRDNYDMDSASKLLELQRSFRDTLYSIDKGCGDRIQPKLASVHKEHAGGETMTMQRMSLAIGVVDETTGEPLSNDALRLSLRPEMFDPGEDWGGAGGDPRRGGRLAPMVRKPVFMAP